MVDADDEIPTLHTERLTLRAFVTSDAPRLHGLVQPAEVLRYFPGRGKPPIDVVNRWITAYGEHWRQHGYGIWAVEARDSGLLVGRCGLQLLPETGETEIDFLYGKPYWGRGLATEAGQAAMSFARQMVQAASYVGIVHPQNLGSRRVLEKLGFGQPEARRYFGMEVLRYVLRVSGSQNELGGT